MTRAEIHEVLREGWMETDAYRAYGHYLSQHRVSANREIRVGRHPMEHGTSKFRDAAQLWWIGCKLKSMRTNGSVRREGEGRKARWYADRPPRVLGQKTIYVPFDPDGSRATLTTTTTEHVTREKAKAGLLVLLGDGRIKGRTRDIVQAVYDTLSGRT